MSKYQTEPQKFPKPLLGRKFTPMAGAAKRRSGLQQTQPAPEHSQTKLPPLKTLPTPKSREASRGKKPEQQAVTEKVSKESLCMRMLQDGYAQSYIDLFYLIHEKFEHLELDKAGMLEINDRLVTAEQFFQEGDFSSAFQVYHDIGKSFSGSEHFDAAIYFYTRCVEIAKKNSLFVEEATAYQGLGSCAFSTKQVSLAIDMFEKGAFIAEQHNLRHSLIQLCKSLTEVYRIQADKLEDEGNFDEALENHMRCLDRAKTAEDSVSEGNASYRIGLLYHQGGELEKALEHFAYYLELSKAAEYIEGVTNALAKMASTYQEMGNIPKAIQILEQLHHEASQNNKQAAEAEASMHLGLLYQKQGKSRNAVQFLEKNFTLVKKLQERSLVDTARVKLGIAKATRDFDEFKDLVAGNVDDLLLWKTNRKTDSFGS